MAIPPRVDVLGVPNDHVSLLHLSNLKYQQEQVHHQLSTSIISTRVNEYPTPYWLNHQLECININYQPEYPTPNNIQQVQQLPYWLQLKCLQHPNTVPAVPATDR